MASKIFMSRSALALRASSNKSVQRAAIGAARQISVTSYTDGQRTESELPISERPVFEDVPKDIDRVAQPFNHEIAAKLNPTMRGFSLEGKVAVVTG